MAARMTAPLYTTDILRLAASLSEPRELDRIDGFAELRSPTCGSRIATMVQLDDQRRVAAISQRVQACAFGQATAALMERGARGRTHGEISEAMTQITRWLAREPDGVGDWPGLLELAPARHRKSRHGAILLPFRALLAAIESAK
jgi:NifU-like protein involved in Fe-S cluster formation